MNRSIAIAIALSSTLAAGVASAQEATQDFANQVLSTRSRAEVKAELAAAREARQLDVRNASAVYGSFKPADVGSARSRAEVRAELRQVLADGNRLSQGDRVGG
ncbi:MAG: DUF4148 domain-containing protein [Piscinibacter sp.]|nr:DUF4148 domain-containing protein [Piscinibacter sp.]